MVLLDSSRYYKLSLQYSSLAFLYYDYTLTFGGEVRYIWSKPLRTSALLYVFCRYAMLANILYLLAYVGHLEECVFRIHGCTFNTSLIFYSCDTWYQVVSAISIFGRIGIMTVMSIRAYVVWGRNKIVLGFVALVELACIVLACVKVPWSACRGGPVGPVNAAAAAQAIAALIFDVCVTVLTIFRTHMAIRKWKFEGVGYKHTMLYFIWKQGMLYFIAVSGIQLAAIIVPVIIPAPFFRHVFSAFTLPLSGLLSARFILHLQEWADSQRRQIESFSVFSVHDMAFAPVVHTQSSDTKSSVLDDFGTDPVTWVPARDRPLGSAVE